MTHLSLVLGSAILSAATCIAAPIQLSPIEYPGSWGTVANGINSAGAIVGRYTTYGDHAFLKSGDVFTTIEIPGAWASTVANGVNAWEEVVGIYADDEGGHGYLYKSGAITTIDYPTASSSDPTFVYGINDKSQIVGSQSTYGFMYDHGAFTPVDVPSASATVATGINNAGQIVGYFYTPGRGRGFVYGADGRFTTIHFPGAVDTRPLAINNRGQIVGQYFEYGYYEPRSFLYERGKMFSIQFPSSAFYAAVSGINDSGLIVGKYGWAPEYGFVGELSSSSPIPEASSAFMVLVGVTVCIARRLGVFPRK